MRIDLSYPRTKTTGQCRLDQNQEAPVLGGQEIQANTYPQHGSIHLEKLPLGTDSIIWTRGDSISRPGVPKKKLRVRGNAKSVSTSCKLCCLNVLYMKSLQLNLFGAWVNCCSGFFFQIAPSSVFHNGTDTVYTVGSTPHSYQ